MSDEGIAELIIKGIGDKAKDLPGVEAVVLRNIALTDGNGTLGISLDVWFPGVWEMSGDRSYEPSVSSYSFSVQHLVKWADRQDGERIHREAAKAVRLMLYRDPDLQVSLRQIFVQDEFRRERVLRYNVTNQRYGSTEAGNGVFVFMSVTEFLVETETVSIG